MARHTTTARAPASPAEAIDRSRAPRARAIDPASIVFGLVAIPVRVFSAAEPSHELARAELDALDAVGNDEIALAEFVPATAVDPIYIERSYYLAPGKGGERAYRLLRDALESAKLFGIARYAARGNAYVVMVRPYETGLAMHQLRYADEIKPWDAIDLPELRSRNPPSSSSRARSSTSSSTARSIPPPITTRSRRAFASCSPTRPRAAT